VLTVGSVAERSHATVARIFLPLHTGSAPVSWSEIAAAAGIEFTAETTWAELDATGVPDSLGLGSPYGMVDETVIAELAPLLSSQAESDELYAVVWPMHADDKPPGIDFTRIVWSDGKTRWHDGQHELARIDFANLDLFSQQANRHFPVALIPGDLGFVVGCAGYSDSLIISGSDDLMHDLAATDLVWLPTPRSAPLPVEYLP